jgi:hypothetical protein
MVGAEDRPPALEQLLADGSATVGVAVGLQIADGVQDELTTGVRGVAQRACGEYVRGELGVGGPVDRLLRIAGGCGGQQHDYSLGGGLLPVGREPVADHRLHQPVHLEAVGVAAGQRVADQRADGVGERVGVGGDAAQRLIEQVGVVADQGQGNRFGGEEGGQLQQLHRGRLLAAQPVQRQRPGGVDPPGIAHDLAAGEQACAAGAEPAQIVARRQVGLLEISGGLGGGQRQVAQFGGELVRQLVADCRDAGAQQRHRLRAGPARRPPAGHPARPNRGCGR